MPATNPITVVSSIDSSILDFFPAFLSPDATPSITTRSVCDISASVVRAFLSHHPPDRPVTLIPILRGALPMYVAAYPLFPDNDTILVRCSKNKELHGPESVIVEWMGRKPATHEAHDGGHGKERQLPGKRVERRHMIILDTVLATGDTVVKLCDELHALQPSATGNGEVGRDLITVLSCYGSPEALAAVAAHPAVGSILVGHRADRVDEHGYLVPPTHGDVGDKLFGKKDK